jgi:hypothetical protein
MANIAQSRRTAGYKDITKGALPYVGRDLLVTWERFLMCSEAFDPFQEGWRSWAYLHLSIDSLLR